MHPITMKKGDDFMYKVIAGNSSKVDVLNGEKILLRSISPNQFCVDKRQLFVVYDCAF